MKVLIPIVIGLLVVGCGDSVTIIKPLKEKFMKETLSKGEDKNSTKAKPVKEITIKNVAGTYEFKRGDITNRYILLGNGDYKIYKDDNLLLTNNGLHEGNNKWKINSDGELHFEDKEGFVTVCRIQFRWRFN